MRYLSVCSGIEAATLAFHSLGWEPVAFSEIEPFPCAVLKHYYPNVPNWGDMTKFKEWPDEAIDLLVGGTPCQSFSIAGLRKGLDDPRGNLMLTYGSIAKRYQPRWIIWENVPGVLSSNKGRDFGAFLGMLAELGYGFAYRVLDAQWFGVPQRRRRVFVIGYLGDWRRAATVLFESESLRGDPAPSREKGKRVAPTLSRRSKSRGYGDEEMNGAMVVTEAGAGFWTEGLPRLRCSMAPSQPQTIVAFGGNRTSGPIDVATAVNSHGGPSGRIDFESETFIAFSCKDHGADAGNVAPTLRGMSEREGNANAGGQVAVSGTLRGHTRPGSNSLAGMVGVRRLTPRECERLQGFPDDYILIQYRNKPAADGPRYKALGNSMAVPCMAWLGNRIQMVEDLNENPIR